MKFTLNWLKEFVSYNGGAEALAKSLTMAGLEVESLAPLRDPASQSEDWLFEIAVTPNRGDCLGLMGLASEIAALTGALVKAPELSPAGKESLKKRVTIEIEDSALCARYSARIVDGLRIGAAPAWLRFRLESCGIRSINNVVDITNYVMLETGQPLHAFDLERLPNRAIRVRPARETKKIATLDGVERELGHQDLLICDGDVPIALAGVMGGLDTEVRAETRSILLESANFDPMTIRKTAKRLALHSEASHRFERGVDPEATLVALDRAVYLLTQHAGAVAAKGTADRYPRKPRPHTLTLREGRIEQLLGVAVEGKQAQRLLSALGLKAQRQAKNKSLKVALSSRRPDLSREADLIEELARVRGYDAIPTTLPALRASGSTETRLGWERKLRGYLTNSGLAEVINLPFVTDESNRLFAGLWFGAATPVAVLNPLAKERAEMRLSLLPGLLENVQTNLAHKAESFHAFHLGKVFRRASDGGSEERHYLSALLYGPRPRRGLREKHQAALGFLDAKGLVEALFDLLHIDVPVTWTAATEAFLHPGRSANFAVGETRVGCVGQIHPEVTERLGVKPFLVCELDLEELLQYAPRQIAAPSLPRFPSVERDFAVVVDGDFPAQRIVGWIESLGEALIEQADVFDQYLGAPIPEGKKSLAYKILYRAEDRTLTDAEINTLHQKLVEQIGKVFGAARRS
ncbi:MAG: phenylalanine--tRNA ligase subunit beta [Deltaproteobacteria bacterium]|nr:phenylalanine--tRNA ligase subunit beta [Deltaproteobacteria bacterium]